MDTKAKPPIPVILDTDIGTDIDDTWALAHLLRSPELKLELLLTAAGDIDFRTKIAARFLQEAGRPDIIIGKGVSGVDTPPNLRNQEGWIKNFDLASYRGRVEEDGIERMIEIIEASSVPVTIVAIAPSLNLAAALVRAPHIAARCRLVGMFGSFSVGYSGGLPAVAETNVRVAPDALRAVLSAPWQDILLTPLDTCNFAVLEGANYRKVWAGVDQPLLRAVVENYIHFATRVDWMTCDYFTSRSTVLFDCVAVYLAYSEALVEVETIRFDINAENLTVRNDARGLYRARVALRWKDLSTFLCHLTDRLCGDRTRST